MNHPGDDQYGGQHPGPGQGQTVVQGGPPGQPQYVAASPPGVAVQLPSSTPQYPPQGPGVNATAQGYGQASAAAPQYAAAAAPHAPAAPQAPQSQPKPQASRRAGPNDDQLIQGGAKTVYEFGGAYSEEARSGGKHKTFFADGAELASVAVVEERQRSNLDSGSGSTFIIGGIVLAVVGGLLAFFVMAGDGDDADADEGEVADQAEVAAPLPEPAPVEEPPAEEAPAADAGAAAEGEAAAPTEEAAPAEAPKPAEEAAAPEPEPEPKPQPAKKKSSSSTTKKKTTTDTKPARKIPAISPSKPPRESGLENLPAPD